MAENRDSVLGYAVQHPGEEHEKREEKCRQAGYRPERGVLYRRHDLKEADEDAGYEANSEQWQAQPEALHECLSNDLDNE